MPCLAPPQVYRYLLARPNGVVLVHCTHGFNRTGYMITRWAPSDRLA